MTLLFRDVDGGSVSRRGTVVCIGAFDGLHLGHQSLIRRTRERARELAFDTAVLAFEPIPREFFLGAQAPARVASWRDRFERLRNIGIDHVGMLRFNAALASMQAEEFIERVLVQRLAAREVWTGVDFRFGRGRRGDLPMLQVHGATHGFTAQTIDTHHHVEQRVSSSAIRAALAAGDLKTAEHMLGRPYSIANRVVRGKQLGRTLGYPTANLRLAGRRPALGGIFATRVHGVGSQPWPSVSSLGTRPTVNGVEPLLEAHLFDFDGDLYGQRIEVEFVAKLRDEEKFADLPALVVQMNRDAAEARSILRSSACSTATTPQILTTA
ncbi:MAG: bifunctional riboflavin kinase/FAD synthetase [Pseudomarimonas sp.]